MEQQIKFIASSIIAVSIYFISRSIEMKVTNGNKYTKYKEKVNLNNVIKLCVYSIVSIICYAFCKKIISFPVINYIFLAFSIKSTYAVIIIIFSFLWHAKNKNKIYNDEMSKDFAYMDSVIMLNFVGFVFLGLIYQILRIQGVLYPYTGEIGTMIMLMAIMSLYFDSFNIYIEYERQNSKSLASKIANQKWNIPDRIYLNFHLIKSFLKNKLILGGIIFYLLLFILTLLSNWNIN